MGKPGKDASRSVKRKFDANSAEPIEFFKTFNPRRMSHKVRVSRTFMKKYKGDIPKNALIKNVQGNCWPVKIENVEGKLFFTYGWRNYVRDHSLQDGDRLHFISESRHVFTAKVFHRDESIQESGDINSVKVEPEEEVSRVEDLNTDVPNERSSIHEDEQEGRIVEYTAKVFHRDESMQESGDINSVKVEPEESRVGDLNTDVPNERSSSHEDEQEGRIVEHGKPIIFEKTFLHRMAYNITIGKSYVISNGIILPGEDEPRHVCYLYNKGTGYKQEVFVYQKYDGRLVIGRGWKDFWVKHDIGRGHKCIFEFFLDESRNISHIVVQVLEDKK